MSTETEQSIDVMSAMFPDLVGTRVAFVGGAGSVGRTTAKLAQQLGATVVVVDVSDEQIERCRALLGDVEAHTANAMDAASIAEALKAAEADHIVLSTGWPLFVRLRDMDTTAAMEWVADRLVPILAIGKWIARNPGKTRSFTIVSGFIPRRPDPGMALWSLMGPAVVGLAENLVVELSPTRVNVVGPGPMVDSDMAKNAVGGEDAMRTLIATLEQALPTRRAVRLVDTARQVLYLVGDPVATGSFRQVEGGASLTAGLGFEHK